MKVLFVYRFLAPDSSWVIITNLLIGMLMMVSIHSLVTAIRGREKNYLLLGLFFSGALINSLGNIYVKFFVTTVEPYIGSWIMMGSFVLFIETYLALPFQRGRVLIGKIILFLCGAMFLLSAYHNIAYGRGDTPIIYVMDIVTVLLLLGLMGFLLFHALRGNRRAFFLFFLEMTIVIGGIAALGVVKNLVVDSGIFPVEFFQSNMVFIVGMSLNGLLFSNLLGFELMDTKVKQALAEERNHELKELHRIKSELMMNISHEFRTPITVIGGVLKQLKQGRWGDSIKANRRSLEIIEKNNLRLLKQVDNLIQLTRLEDYKNTMRPVPLDVSKVITTLTGEFSSLAQQNDIKLLVALPDSIILSADAALLRTVMVNLLGNAVKFTPPGGTITVGASLSKKETRIYVKDTGPGIPEEEQQKVFHRFHQGRNNENKHFRGTGIGLSLVKEVMEQHGGRVVLESSPGRGSSFTLVFPRSEKEKESQAETDSTPQLSTAGQGPDPLIAAHGVETEIKTPNPTQIPETRGERFDTPEHSVLLVEDDPDLTEYLTAELAPLFQLRKASNGLEALELMRRETPDLVISDIMMPEMDGYGLLSAMQEDDELRLIPILILTARRSDEEKITAYEQGVVGYIEKPFSMDILIARARNIIESKKDFKKGYQKYVKQSLVSYINELTDEGAGDEVNFTDFCRQAGLTEREQEIALLLHRGMSDKEIASRLGLSAKTIGNHNSSIFRKCGLGSRTELAAWGR